MPTNTNEAAAVKKVFNVRDEKLDWFKSQMGKLAKRAAKTGCPAPSFVVGEMFEQPVVHFSEAHGREIIVGYRRLHPVTVEGQAPKYAGWTFAATLQHLAEGETLIRNITETEAPVEFRAAAAKCDHCRTARRRNDTFLVVNEQGVWKQIGRNCIADFLGHKSPELLAAMAEYVSAAMGLGEDGEGFGGGGAEYNPSIGSFLAITCGAIRWGGWVSRTKAREMGEGAMATADVAMKAACPGNSKEDKEFAADVMKHVNDIAAKTAEEALDWVLNLDDAETAKSEYLHNIRAVARAGSVTFKLAGYAASIIVAFEKAMDRKRERQALPESNYQGEVGKRMVRTVTVRATRFLESAYGSTCLMMMNDAEGNDYKWFASSAEYEVGATLTLNMTVKKHEEYKGRKQTLVSRCTEFVEKPKKNKKNEAVAAGTLTTTSRWAGASTASSGTRRSSR